jgi:prepilin-type N-terminal cleavage/methylation domain-containing protein
MPCLAKTSATMPTTHIRPAFTLLEVVVVVAIIGLVTVLLLAGLSSARRAGVRAACQTNLHSIGIATSEYAVRYNAALPTHYADDTIAFDTFRIRCENGDLVNLGLLTSLTDNPKSLYCPGQRAEASPCLAYNSPENAWMGGGDSGGGGPGPRGGPSGGGGGGAGGGGGGSASDDHAEPRAGVNPSYAARFRSAEETQMLRWNVYNYANKVIYSDFVGVNGWQGRGRFTNRIGSPHQGDGYNRLFGDGSVSWAAAAALDATRPVSDTEPSAHELQQYYLALDVLR